MTKDINHQLSALKQLIEKDRDLRALSKYEDKINIFNIIKNGATEIRHSNILAWLLRVHESHNLGETFIREFVKVAIKNNPEKGNILDWAFLDYSSQIVQTEEKRIDITIRFESTKHIIAIENKTKSVEHEAAKTGKMQTPSYREEIEKAYPDSDYKKLFIYLTPNGESPADGEWCILSYEDILTIIENLLNQEQMLPEVKLILSNYCALIKNDVIGKDNDLFKACNQFYREHTEALELLFLSVNKKKKKKNMDPQLLDLCDKIYSLYANELAMIYNNREDPVGKIATAFFDYIHNTEGFALSESAGKTYISFSSKTLDQYLPQLNTRTSSWNTTNTYLFWFYTGNLKEKGTLRFALELGGQGLPADTYVKQQKITAALKPKDKRPEYQYKIVHSATIQLGKDISEEKLRTAFEEGIRYAQEWTEESIKILSE